MEYYGSLLKQAPDDMWRIITDTKRYGIKSSPSPKIIAQNTNDLIGRVNVKGKLVYLKGSDGAFSPYIKLDDAKLKSYPYIPIKYGNKLIVEPYYVWVAKNEHLYKKENPSLLAKAKGKLDKQTLAAIQAGEYSYSFDSATSGQVDLDVSNYELLDEVRYSAEGDSRNLFKVKKDNSRIFIYDKNNDVVIVSDKKLNRGDKVNGIGIIGRVFRYKLPEMINFSENLFIPTNCVTKSDDGYIVEHNTKPLFIKNGKLKKVSNKVPAGTGILGDIVQPIVNKKFSFVILNDSKDRVFLVKLRDLNEVLSNFDSEYTLIGGNNPFFQTWDKAVSFEGGDVDDFYGGDVNFCGIDGTEVVSFDYSNMDSNNSVLGDYQSNTEIDLSFNGSSEIDEQLSNAFGDFLKKIFKKKDTELTEEQAKKIADKNKVEYTPEEVETLHKKSKTKKPLGQWIKSDEGKQFLSTIQNFGYKLLMKKNTAEDKGGEGGSGSNDVMPKDDDEKKILGMHPVTFGIVTIVSLSTLGVAAWLIFKKK